MSEFDSFPTNPNDIELAHLGENAREALLNMALLAGSTTSELYARATAEIGPDTDPSVSRRVVEEMIAAKAGQILQAMAADIHEKSKTAEELFRETGLEDL